MSDEKTLSKAQLRQKRLDELEQNEKKKKLIVGVVVGILIVIFIGGIILGLNNILTTEGTMANPNDTSLSADPETPEQGIEALKIITMFRNNPQSLTRVRLNISTALSVDDGSITDNTEDERFDAVLKYIKSDMLNAVAQSYDRYEETYGSDYIKELLPDDFTAGDLKSFECVASEDSTNRELHFVFNEAEYPQQENSLLYKNFGMESCGSIEKAAVELIAPIASVKESAIKCADFEIIASYNADENLAKEIKYLRKYEVKATVDFTGELAELGEREIAFTVVAEEKHGFTYAGLRLNKNRMWLEKGDTDNLEAIRTYDSEMLDEQGREAAKVVWTISDPEIATVDEEGYVKGRKVSDKPVILTATYSFLGNEYKDSCEVYVRVPLEEIRVAQRELTLNVGDTSTVEIKFKPEKATFKSVDWFSSDESVATVDENGNVTARAAGEAEVFAISLDGNFKSTCKITVKDGAVNG